MLRYFFASFILIVCAVVAVAGFRGTKMTHPPIEIFPDMDHQPKYQPQHPSSFFADGRVCASAGGRNGADGVYAAESLSAGQR